MLVPTMPSNPRETARALIAAVVHEGTPRNEVVEKAIAACRLVDEYKLLDAAPASRISDINPVDVMNATRDIIDAFRGGSAARTERRATRMKGSGKRHRRY